MGIELKNIKKSFSKTEVIKNISLSINDDELTVFVGPSGCGKSTLLRIISGLEKEDCGDILFDNKRVNDISPFDRSIGMVFQSYALYPHMTVYQNLEFCLRSMKIKKDERKKRVIEASELLFLTPYLSRKPKELSGGQRQRVAIARALVRSPHIFLFDEPLSNLDALLRSKMRIEIARLRREKKALAIYVTHDQVEAMTLGDSIVVMNQGMIEQKGTPTEIYLKPRNKFVAGFIGSPSMNFIELNSIADKFHHSLSPPSTQTIGFRPEHALVKPLAQNKMDADMKMLSLSMTLYAKENLGSEMLLYGRIEHDREVVVKLSMKEAQDNDLLSIHECWLYIPYEHIYFFNKNEEAIY